MVSKKCPRCNGCMQYLSIVGRSVLYCDFCKRYYTRNPGGELVFIEDIKAFEEEAKHPKWIPITNTKVG